MIPAPDIPGHSRHSPARAAALVGGGTALVIIAAAVGIGLYHAPGTGPGIAAQSRAGAAMPAPPSAFGIPTVTSGCAAAAMRSGTARCPQAPECWTGVVKSSGEATAGRLPCRKPHVWETFAIGVLPAGVPASEESTIAANPAVRAVCSLPVLLRSRRARARLIPRRSWEIAVLPPGRAALADGARAYRCLAHARRGPDPRASLFSR